MIWHCWQNHTAHEPAQHNALQRVLTDQDKIDKRVA